jgi:hypothetical protein
VCLATHASLGSSAIGNAKTQHTTEKIPTSHIAEKSRSDKRPDPETMLAPDAQSIAKPTIPTANAARLTQIREYINR